MTLREKILKTFIVTIREVNKHGGPKSFFDKYPVGGMYFNEGTPVYDENGMEMGTSATYERIKECRKYSKQRLFICADEAFVDGQKLPIAYSQKAALGSTKSKEDAYNYGKTIGMQMNSKGIDWVLEPSIDIRYDHLMYLTAISDDPKIIAELNREVVRGVQDQGVCATAKHFPGIGTAFINMHIAAGANTLPFDEWMETYGYTYKEMFKQDVMAVMTTHATLKSYDNETTDGYEPIATYSKKLTTDLLKNELGFKGAVVTDALIMGGMATGDLVAEAVQAFKAGADFLLWPPVEAAEAIEKAIENGEIPMSRLDDALSRIERMESFRLKALEENKMDTPDAEYVDNTIIDTISRGICLLKNDINLVPLKKECNKILIVDVTDEDENSTQWLAQELRERGYDADVKRDIYDVPSRVCWQSDIDALQSEYDTVIFNMNAHFVAEWSETHMLIWASHLFNKQKKIIINYGSPFFATDYFPEDPTFIEMNCKPSKQAIKELADRLLGEKPFMGTSILVKA